MNEYSQKIPFYDMFSCCGDDIFKPLSAASVLSAVVDSKNRSMRLKIEFPQKPPPIILSMTENEIAGEFGLREVSISAISADFKPPAPPSSKKQPKFLLGKQIRANSIPISELSYDSGKVTVEGEVFDFQLRTVKNGSARIVEFSITDYSNSLRISKFLREDDGDAITTIKDGMFLKIQGLLAYNRFYGDNNLEPTAIELLEKPQRLDSVSGDKRVELHIHSKLSALDAVADPEEIVETAARFGHKAVAITDHGVCQAFPIVAKAGKKLGIKIIYGIEAYYINDLDDRIVVSGSDNCSLTDEFVVFDIETTGLDMRRHKITEIAAVIYKNGEILSKFETYVNPDCHIPEEITRLTGIRDDMVADAPALPDALRAFLDFAANRPLIAHNADFDTGFISEACKSCNIDFNCTSLDTVTLSQSLLRDLKKHSLDSITHYLGLPDFKHHRAADDVTALCRIVDRFFADLTNLGITQLSQINAGMIKLRSTNSTVKRSPRHIILLVREQRGLKNLYKLVSASHMEYFKKHPVIPKSLLLRHKDGLIIGSACENSEIFRAVISGKSDRELLRISELYDYFEIQPLHNNYFMIENGSVSDEERLRDFNRRIVKLGEITGKPVVATCDAHFIEPQHEIFRRILISNKFPDADRELPLFFRTTDEMLSEFAYLGSDKALEVVVTNTNKIADSCEDIQPLPKKLYIPNMKNSAENLKNIVYGKMIALYGENPPELVKLRVDTEMQDIINCGYDVIYMSAQILVARSLDCGYLVGSRGSVGSSVVAFLAGITEVNALPPHYRCPNCQFSDFSAGSGFGCGIDMPDALCPICGSSCVKDGFDIPFETFLGFGGDKVPDIDLNFSGEYQAHAHRHAIEMFGEAFVFRAGTIGGIAEKTAFGYVKKYFEERGRQVSKAEEARLSAALTGVKRTTGQHPGGLVVIPDDMEVYDFCPVQFPADSLDSDVITTHFEYHSMENNLLKLDLLGHDDPSVIKMLQDLTGIDARNIPLDDLDTMSIFKSPLALDLPDNDPIIGNTGSIAVPEFGTKFTREMLVDTQPELFSTLVRLSGFSHGTDVWLGNAKDLIMNKTAPISDVIGCRDDIMLYLISKGMEAKKAFAIMESVRKGKGLSSDWVQDMQAIDVPDWYIDSCKKIKYLFPKAHAVAYVMMAVRIAWFKVHRPIEFYCVYFTVRAPAFSLDTMTAGADRVRAKIRELESKPDIKPAEKDLLVSLEVCYEFYLRGFEFKSIDLKRSDATKFTVDGNTLIPPFTALNGLGEAAARDLAAIGKNGGFISVEELAAACPKVSKTHIEQLKKAGAFGDLPDSSQLSLF